MMCSLDVGKSKPLFDGSHYLVGLYPKKKKPIWWALWTARNNFLFKGVAIDLQNVISMIQNMCPYKTSFPIVF